MLELKGICYSAEDESRETEILRDIDVTIDDRFVAVTGPNGQREVHSGQDCGGDS